MKNDIGCEESDNDLYNKFLISESKYLDNAFDLFASSSETYCAFILRNISYKFLDTTPYTKVIYVSEGSLNININSLSTILGEGYFLFVNAHSNVKTVSNTKDTTYFNFDFKREFFHPDFMKRLSQYEVFYNFINFCLMGKKDNKAYLAFAYNKCKSERLLYIMLSCIQNHEDKLLESSLLFLFENLCMDKNSRMIPSLSTLVNASIVNLMIKYISNNYTNITLDDLATHFNYHPNYISKLIKQETGKTFQSHVQTARLKQAAYLLISTNSYIRDIAFDLGYIDTSYFNKIFKKEYHCTPSEFREKHINVSNV